MVMCGGGEMKSSFDIDGGGEEAVYRRGRQKLESADLKNGSKLNGNGSSRGGKHSKMSSNGCGSRSKSSSKKRRRESSVTSDSSSGKEDTDWSSSVGPSSSSESDDGARKSRKRRKHTTTKPGSSSSDQSSSDGLTSESEDKCSKRKTSGSREKKSGRKKDKMDRKIRPKEKRSRRSESSRNKDVESVSKKNKDRTKSRDKSESRHKKERRSKHTKEGSKKKFKDKLEDVFISPQEEVVMMKNSRTALQDKMDAQEQQKALIRHNAEMAKARLASGDMQRARDEQAEMQRLYGTVDWRAKKKLRSEKKRLERTIAAGTKLANLEEREMARMDAFRVALGLPTAEAQRQAEWRAEATRALAEQEATMKETPAFLLSARSAKHSVIGPRLPHRSPT